jgi:hypothetical protein
MRKRSIRTSCDLRGHDATATCDAHGVTRRR